ncbi:hypothetical protein [Psychroserpens damuponensis]|uniref:hypothetical protein n=1 Tax=Psychroserpens damuponensis TaxID=943936 RepID=UPI000590F732|nr:hypothetical protein [Psychroserpens damuponensis]
MRRFIFIFFISYNLAAQENTKHHYLDFVEAYHHKESKVPLYVYDQINGNIVDTLQPIENALDYYKIAIISSEYGWFKIKNIQKLPNTLKDYGYENHWVTSKNFIIHVDNYDENHQVYLYDLPSKKANKIHKVNNYQITSVIEISDLWAKVQFQVGKKTIEGWLYFKDQCAYPWTVCLKYE